MRRAFLIFCCFFAAGCGLEQNNIAAHLSVNQRSSGDLRAAGGLRVNDKTICSAVLLSAKTLLTAAHCLSGAKAADMTFTLDEAPDHDPIFSSAQVESFTIHPSYRAVQAAPDPNAATNDASKRAAYADLGIVYLKSTSYGPAPVSYYTDLVVSSFGAKSVLFGVGYGIEKDGSGGKLHVKEMIYDWLYPVNSPSGTATPNAIVVLSPGPKGQIVCPGDSGGPLIFRQGNKTMLVGIASEIVAASGGEVESCQTAKYAIYTALGPYDAWIKSLIH